jgi:hypothetical protein
MFQTIQIASCVSVQGDFVEALGDGRVVIRVGATQYRGRPIQEIAPEAAVGPGVCVLEAAKTPS